VRRKARSLDWAEARPQKAQNGKIGKEPNIYRHSTPAGCGGSAKSLWQHPAYSVFH
jgi:hypothetical protein